MNFFRITITRRYTDTRLPGWETYNFGVLAAPDADAEAAALRLCPASHRPHNDEVSHVLTRANINLTNPVVLFMDKDGDY